MRPEKHTGKMSVSGRKKAVITTVSIVSAVAFVTLLSVFLLKAVFPVRYREAVLKYSAEAGLEPRFVFAVIKTESSFDPDAISNAGAIGLMQLMPATAAFIAQKNGLEFNVYELYNPERNIMIGCTYLKYLIARFGDKQTAMCAYNAGEGNVAAWLNDARYSGDGKTLFAVPFAETGNYIKRVNFAEKIYKYVV